MHRRSGCVYDARLRRALCRGASAQECRAHIQQPNVSPRPRTRLIRRTPNASHYTRHIAGVHSTLPQRINPADAFVTHLMQIKWHFSWNGIGSEGFCQASNWPTCRAMRLRTLLQCEACRQSPFLKSGEPLRFIRTPGVSRQGSYGRQIPAANARTGGTVFSSRPGPSPVLYVSRVVGNLSTRTSSRGAIARGQRASIGRTFKAPYPARGQKGRIRGRLAEG